MSIATTFIVTVPFGTGGGYYIDGVQKPIIPVVTGGTFKFNQNDSTNNNHPLALSTTTSTAGRITTGVVYYLDGVTTQADYYNLTLFNAAAVRYIEITVAETSDFYYICNVHGSGMGNVMDVTFNSWSALSWNEGAWNQLNDEFVSLTTAGELSTSINIGFGWGRESWSEGNWNSNLGFVLTGNGDIFSITTTSQLTTTANNIIITASAPIIINSEQLNSSTGNIQFNGDALIFVTGEELLSATVNTFAVAAGGSITINTPTLEANVELNNNGINIGLATLFNVVGFPLSINLGETTQGTGNIINILGEELTSSVNTIVISGSSPVTIIGNGVVISLSNANVTTQQILSLIGNQANVSVSTLKFWDNIDTSTNTETWVNIH